MLNRATGKQRIAIGVAAMVLLVPFVLWANDIGKVVHLSRVGELIEGQITERDPDPKHGRAYSAFRYSYRGVEHFGRAGISYAVGERVQLTVAPDDPANYWVGKARGGVLNLILSSVLGAAWLSLGAAFLVRLPFRENEP